MFMDGKSTSANRVSWALHFGQIPDGLFVLHKCDTPLCVNPDHLFLGTQSDNLRDMARKNRDANWQRGKTHCPKGHAYAEHGVYWSERVGRSGVARRQRTCKQCKVIRGLERTARRNAVSA
jgi:hypothetical protein